jgi:hypothetical protein
MSRIHPPSQPHRAALAAALTAALTVTFTVALLLASACGPSPEQATADREEIAAQLRAYGRLLSQAYAFSDGAPLAPVAMPREIASVERNIALLAADGRRIASDQKELVVEDVRHFQGVNAYVLTYEVWDLRVLAAGSDRELSREDNQQSRVRYHVKRNSDGVWQVVWRQRLEDAGGGAP